MNACILHNPEQLDMYFDLMCTQEQVHGYVEVTGCNTGTKTLNMLVTAWYFQTSWIYNKTEFSCCSGKIYIYILEETANFVFWMILLCSSKFSVMYVCTCVLKSCKIVNNPVINSAKYNEIVMIWQLNDDFLIKCISLVTIT